LFDLLSDEKFEKLRKHCEVWSYREDAFIFDWKDAWNKIKNERKVAQTKSFWVQLATNSIYFDANIDSVSDSSRK
jgi:hypothetical protein